MPQRVLFVWEIISYLCEAILGGIHILLESVFAHSLLENVEVFISWRSNEQHSLLV